MIRASIASSILQGSPLKPTPHPTLPDALRAAAASRAALTFVDAAGQRRPMPWSEVRHRARRFCGSLLQAGLRRGDRVALILPTAPSFPVAFFGVLLAGGVPVPLYPPVRLGRLAEWETSTASAIEATGARMILSDENVRRLLGGVFARTRPALGLRGVEELAAASPGETERTARQEELALIQFSSGSTVDPKPVALDHGNLLSNVFAIDAYLRSVPCERHAGVSWLPLYHDMGLVGCLLLSLCHPGPLTLIPPELFLSRPAIWLRAISEDRATISPAPNFAYALCARRIRDEELRGVDLSGWRLALNGAEPIASAAVEAFCSRFARWGFDRRALVPVYGLSEATLAVTFRDPGTGLHFVDGDGRAIASVGRPLAGIEVAVRRGGSVVPEGEVGTIFVRGPSVTRGYFARPEKTARALVDGWLDTGDLGFVRDGELFVSGRRKDVVIVRGRNHPPQRFEEALLGIAELREGCAIALGLAGREGEELAMLCELRQGVEADEAIAEKVRARVVEATGVRPGRVLLLRPGTLPRTSSGKLRRAEAKRRLQAGTLAPPDPVTPLRLAAALLRSRLSLARARLGL